ncbi:outer membrane protein [Defluviicoccus vanus]|uniref:Outer membrane beta-barrel protein n=1 Tax=Defluviicoccus vanus TaxID=111831 RepID=A0A7H1MYV3_9PROT|nr:outer membrane beta-barrel protein [Defluviicoccus vanus]QNT68639.1 outer membrane beta-barrel protein [Defluviicoccus vanus]
MTKMGYLPLAVVTVCGIAMTAKPAHAQSVFDGGYVGLQIGASSLTSDSKFSDSYLQNFNDGYFRYERNDRIDQSGFGVTGGGFGGYGMTFGKLYLGGEVEFGASSASSKNQDDRYNSFDYTDPDTGERRVGTRSTSETTELESGISVGVAARAGYEILPNGLLYLRAGWQGTSYKITNRARVNGGTDTSQSLTNREFLNGVRVGAGGEFAVTPNIFVRLDYTYTLYQEFDDKSAPMQDSVGGTDTYKITAQPEEQMFRIGLGWHF